MLRHLTGRQFVLLEWLGGHSQDRVLHVVGHSYFEGVMITCPKTYSDLLSGKTRATCCVAYRLIVSVRLRRYIGSHVVKGFLGGARPSARGRPMRWWDRQGAAQFSILLHIPCRAKILGWQGAWKLEGCTGSLEATYIRRTLWG